MLGGYSYYLYNILQICYKQKFKGWGKKRTGHFAYWCNKVFGGKLTLLEVIIFQTP
jgi:capsular polysaccharide export protein